MATLNYVLPRDRNGNVIHSPLSQYEIVREPSDAEASNDPLYYGGLALDGQWYIKKRQVSAGVMHFCKGTGGFLAAWADKESQAYDEFDEIF